jgi:hypothetical protein
MSVFLPKENFDSEFATDARSVSFTTFASFVLTHAALRNIFNQSTLVQLNIRNKNSHQLRKAAVLSCVAMGSAMFRTERQ